MARIVSMPDTHKCSPELNLLLGELTEDGKATPGVVAECSCGKRHTIREDPRDSRLWWEEHTKPPGYLQQVMHDVGTQLAAGILAQAKAAASHRWTSHGHRCCREAPLSIVGRPRVHRCGGPRLCKPCAVEAAEAHS